MFTFGEVGINQVNAANHALNRTSCGKIPVTGALNLCIKSPPMWFVSGVPANLQASNSAS